MIKKAETIGSLVPVAALPLTEILCCRTINFFGEYLVAWLDILWNHRKLRDNERGEDEVCYHFAIITVIDGIVNLHPHSTGKLNSLPDETYLGDPDATIPVTQTFTTPGFWGRIRSQVFVPNMNNPYLGIAVRGIELDNSSSGNRKDDYNGFTEAVKNRAEEIVADGGLPTTADLTAAGSSVGLKDRRARDDDDLIGVGSIVSASLGQSNRVFDGILNTEALMWTNIERLELEGSGARWRPEIAVVLRFGDPGTIPRFETKAYRGTIPQWPDP